MRRILVYYNTGMQKKLNLTIWACVEYSIVGINIHPWIELVQGRMVGLVQGRIVEILWGRMVELVHGRIVELVQGIMVILSQIGFFNAFLA